MAEFKAGVANALHPDAAVEMSTRGNEESTRAATDSMRGGGKSGKLVWHPWGTDNQLLADATDLIEAMGVACSTPVDWRVAGTTADLDSRQARKKLDVHMRLPSRRVSSVLHLVGGRASLMFGGPAGAKNVEGTLRGRRAEYAAFVSYYRAEAGADARRLQTALEAQLERPVFLDVTAADRIDEILTRGVARSGALILLQTKGVLTRPWCLLEIYWALRCGIPIVPVALVGAEYDFESARKLLGSLRGGLVAANPGAVAAIEQQLTTLGGIDFKEFAAALNSTVREEACDNRTRSWLCLPFSLSLSALLCSLIHRFRTSSRFRSIPKAPTITCAPYYTTSSIRSARSGGCIARQRQSKPVNATARQRARRRARRDERGRRRMWSWS